jgi:hypothetical protein
VYGRLALEQLGPDFKASKAGGLKKPAPDADTSDRHLETA